MNFLYNIIHTKEKDIAKHFKLRIKLFFNYSGEDGEDLNGEMTLEERLNRFLNKPTVMEDSDNESVGSPTHNGTNGATGILVF